jgi:hypothetical protein
VGGVLVILAVSRLIQSLRTRKKEEIQGGAGLNRKPLSPSRPFFLAGAFGLYILMIKGTGFFVSTFAFIVVSSRLIGANDWARPLALALVVDLFCYWVFEIWLKLSLPRGFLF